MDITKEQLKSIINTLQDKYSSMNDSDLFNLKNIDFNIKEKVIIDKRLQDVFNLIETDIVSISPATNDYEEQYIQEFVKKTNSSYTSSRWPLEARSFYLQLNKGKYSMGRAEHSKNPISIQDFIAWIDKKEKIAWIDKKEKEEYPF